MQGVFPCERRGLVRPSGGFAMKILAVTIFLAAVFPATAFAQDATIVSREVVVAGTRSLAAAKPPARFNLVGLHWQGTGSVEFRTRSAPGRWREWVQAAPEPEDRPDAGTAERARPDAWRLGNPWWVGPSDGIEYRFRGRVRRARAFFVWSAPTAVPLRTLQKAGSPGIVPRSGWGANEAIKRAAPLYTAEVRVAIVHHTAGSNGYGAAESPAIVRAIQTYHVKGNGWNDIGYNFLVDKYGQIFEGRTGGAESAIVGAQTQGFNSVSTGVACLGDFSAVAQTEAGMDALARVIGWKLSLHGIPVAGEVTVTSAGGESSRFRTGAAVTFARISGHRDGNATACPGDVLYGQLADLRVRAARYAGTPAGVTVRAASTRLRGSVTARLSGAVRFPDGSSAAGAPVDILYATAGGAFSPVTSARCAADGRWSTTIDLPQSGTVRARFPGDATRAPLESTSLAITILPRLALAVSSRWVPRGADIAVSGVAWPSTADSVALLLDRKVRGRYRRVRRHRVPLRATRYRRLLRPARRGLYRVTVRVDGATAREYVRVF